MSEQVMSNQVPEDIDIECTWCKNNFVFCVKEQEFFKEKSYDFPKKCKECIKKKKQINKTRTKTKTISKESD